MRFSCFACFLSICFYKDLFLKCIYWGELLSWTWGIQLIFFATVFLLYVFFRRLFCFAFTVVSWMSAYEKPVWLSSAFLLGYLIIAFGDVWSVQMKLLRYSFLLSLFFIFYSPLALLVSVSTSYKNGLVGQNCFSWGTLLLLSCFAWFFPISFDKQPVSLHFDFEMFYCF